MSPSASQGFPTYADYTAMQFLENFHPFLVVKNRTNQKDGAPKTSFNFQNPGDVTEVGKRFKFPHEFKGRPGSTPEVHYDPSEPLNLPEVGSGSKRLQATDDSTVHSYTLTPHYKGHLPLKCIAAA